MTTTDTLDQLYAAVLDTPEDDTVRLVYADALDEQPPVRVRCPAACMLGESGLYLTYEHAGPDSRWVCCGVCHGAGNVPDPTNAQRAELIRVQRELERTDRDHKDPNGSDPDGSDCTICSRLTWLRTRERELLTVARQWESVPCSECAGCGTVSVRLGNSASQPGPCPVCGGTGDLLRGFGGRVSETAHAEYQRTVRWERGFPLVECTSSDVWKTETAGFGWTEDYLAPTPWAVAVSRWAAGFWLTDWNVRQKTDSSGNYLYEPNYGLPVEIAKLLPDRYYHIPDAARLALAFAAAKWVRGESV